MNRWKEMRLGDLIILNYGKSLPTQNRKLGIIPVYSSAGITGVHDHYLVESEGIIIGRKGSVGKVYYSPFPFYCIDTAYYVTPNNDKYDFQFLFYLLQTLGLEDLNEDSAVPGLNRDTAYDQGIILPPLPEQKAIASVLSPLDDKIDLLHRQNKTLETMAETLFRQWFIEEAEDDWESLPLSEVAIIQNGYAFSSRDYIDYNANTYEVLKMGHINPDCTLKMNPKKNFVARSAQLEKYVLKNEDIVMPMTDMKDNVVILGVPALVDKDDKYVLNQRVARIYLKNTKKLSNIYMLFLQLKNHDFICNLQSNANSGVQVNLSTQVIKDSLIFIPPIDKQLRFKDYIQNTYRKISNNRSQIQTLENLRDTLLPKLISGEVRVKVNDKLY